MDSVLTTHPEPDRRAVGAALDRFRRAYYEDPVGALDAGVRAHELGRSTRDSALCARGLALQGAVCLHRGDLRSALALIVDAERHAEESNELTARAEVAALRAQISFFTGSYAEALSQAERAVMLADAGADRELRIFARRATCLVFGNVGVRDWPERLREMLELSLESGDLWEEAISRNDIACHLQQIGDRGGAEQEMARGMQVAGRIPGQSNFVRAVLHSTRADIRLLARRPTEALEDAERSIALLLATDQPNPYVLGVTVRAEVQARMALGQLQDAQQAGEGALSRLGDSVPQTRSLILTTLAEELRTAGRIEAAYDALAQAAQLEREAFQELSELQLSLERATLEITAARRESDALAATNRELATAHAELERRAGQLEALQGQLRDQAERDWLTGLYNRRYLASELERLAARADGAPLSLAVLDLDHFKSINDRFGHAAGDQVLVRTALVLRRALRRSDIAVRSGGEEFLVLMPHTGARAAAVCAERLRAAIRDEPWDEISSGLTVTTSIGIASMSDPDGDLEALVALADQRLYEAKRAGRDQIVG